MKVSPSGLLEHARSPEGRKQIRYAGVSVVFVPIGQVLIQVLGTFVLDKNFTAASIISAAILTLPNFYANKRFVWQEQSSENLKTQMTVFWVAAMLGVAAATTLTWIVEQQFNHSDSIGENIAVFFAQLIGFGIVWVGRYFILDKWIFKATHHGEEPTEAEVAELHHDFPI